LSVARPAIVVVHEIFGLTEHIRSLAARLEEAGYRAYAPDLFGGEVLPYTAEGKQKGLALKNGLGEEALARQVIDTTGKVGEGRPVGVIGFCLGGTLAWLAAGSASVGCTVGYYSVGIGRHLGVRTRCPVMMHFGRTDPSVKADEVRALREAHPSVQVHEYDAGHAFNRDDDAPYHPHSARLAWKRSLAFFARHLGHGA
jgi:carboxymethylenebutenolidase